MLCWQRIALFAASSSFGEFFDRYLYLVGLNLGGGEEVKGLDQCWFPIL